MPTQTDQVLGDLRIIDCDCHFTEPPDLWTARVPASLKNQVPVQRTINGITQWYLDDELWATTGGNAIDLGGQKIGGYRNRVQPFDQIDPAAWRVKDRLAMMDALGFYAQILYPNGVGFSSNHIFAIEDETQRMNILETYNDFLVDVQTESNGRLFPQAMLPIWDMDLTVREMTRLVDAGITGFTLSDKPEQLGLPELLDPYFSPMWDVFNESRAVVNFHIASGRKKGAELEIRAGLAAGRQKGEELGEAGRRISAAEEGGFAGDPTMGGRCWVELSPIRRGIVFSTQVLMSSFRLICNLCMSELFDRYTHLKIVSAESGMGYIPYLLEALEYHVDQMLTDPEELAMLKRRPTEYFRDHIYVTFWFETAGPKKLIEDIGVNNVLVETDVPHPTCLYPGAREHFASVMADLDPHTCRRVLQDNAAELYKIEIPATTV